MNDAEERYFGSLVAAAKYLDRSPRWLEYQLKESPTPPPGFKVGKSWLFKRSELDAWMEKFRAKPAVDLDALVNEVVSELSGKAQGEASHAER